MNDHIARPAPTRMTPKRRLADIGTVAQSRERIHSLLECFCGEIRPATVRWGHAMFDKPTKGDIDRALSTLMHEARHRLAARRNEAMADATKAGALQNTRLIIVVAEAAEKIHVEIMQQATSMLQEFAQRMDIAPSQITEWARPHLENLGNMLLGVVPPCGFPDEQRRTVAQYQAQFDQRLTGALRDVEIGFVKRSGFTGLPKQDEWIRAAEAVAMLKPILTEYSARLRICERAHGGLIRARAEQFHHGQRAFHNHDIPKEFWWAEGHQALKQDWATGDFSTWIERDRIQLKAFGVTFARTDIQKLLPPPNSMKTESLAHTEEDEQIISKLDALVPSAALSYKQAILDLKDDSRVSFRSPALELREALREILDHLAPDSEVTAASGYVQEKDRAGPTMKQKVRFIMKKKGIRSSSDAPEQAVTAFEEAIAALTRAVYERSSKATHVASERHTVVQLRRYVVARNHRNDVDGSALTIQRVHTPRERLAPSVDDNVLIYGRYWRHCVLGWTGRLDRSRRS